MKTSSIALSTLVSFLIAFSFPVQADDFSNYGSHQFPSQVMLEFSIPFGGANSDAIELSFNFNNFENLTTRNVIARFGQNGEIEVPTFNYFGEGAVDWAKANPLWATGVVILVAYGSAKAIEVDDDNEDGFACPDVIGIDC